MKLISPMIDRIEPDQQGLFYHRAILPLQYPHVLLRHQRIGIQILNMEGLGLLNVSNAL